MKLQDADTPEYGQGATNDLKNRESFEVDRSEEHTSELQSP